MIDVKTLSQKPGRKSIRTSFQASQDSMPTSLSGFIPRTTLWHKFQPKWKKALFSELGWKNDCWRNFLDLAEFPAVAQKGGPTAMFLHQGSPPLFALQASVCWLFWHVFKCLDLPAALQFGPDLQLDFFLTMSALVPPHFENEIAYLILKQVGA